MKKTRQNRDSLGYPEIKDMEQRKLEELNANLKIRLDRLIPHPGNKSTAINGMFLLRREEASISEKTFEEPLAAFVIQGAKISYFGANEYRYHANQHLTAVLGMPAWFHTLPATHAKPFLSILFYIDTQMITELLLETASNQSNRHQESNVVHVADTNEELLTVVSNLVKLLDKPEQISVRGPLYLKDLHYLLLLGPFGSCLRQLYTPGAKNNDIFKLVNWIRNNLTKSLTIETLAHQANMSHSSLHRHFKAFTGSSPLQYIKQTRLIEAQRQMLFSGSRANLAAFKTGFESITHFNREYKKMFGDPPHKDTKSPICVKPRINLK